MSHRRHTDRERLGLALAELDTVHGYRTTDIADPWCCTTCLADWMDTTGTPAVGWHVQADEHAFGHGISGEACPECAAIEREAEAKPESFEWWDHQLAHAVEYHHQLVSPLAVLVRGDRDFVAAVIRRSGLRAEPIAIDGWIEVCRGEP